MARISISAAIAAFCAMACVAAASPTTGGFSAAGFFGHKTPLTAPQIRNQFAEKFLIDFGGAAEVNVPGVVIRNADQATFPFLAQDDIDMSIVRVTIEDKSAVPTHVHPRGTEMLLCVKGKIKTTLFPEAGSDGPIVNVLEPFQATAFPAGLAHGQECMDGPCEFVSTLDDSNPGVYFVTPQ